MKECHAIARRLPGSERYALADQLRRASVSVVTNVAEGHSRTGVNEFLHRVSLARGSVAESSALLDVREVVEYVPARVVAEPRALADEVDRMLGGLIGALARRRDTEVPWSRRR